MVFKESMFAAMYSRIKTKKNEPDPPHSGDFQGTFLKVPAKKTCRMGSPYVLAYGAHVLEYSAPGMPLIARVLEYHSG